MGDKPNLFLKTRDVTKAQAAEHDTRFAGIIMTPDRSQIKVCIKNPGDYARVQASEETTGWTVYVGNTLLVPAEQRFTTVHDILQRLLDGFEYTEEP